MQIVGEEGWQPCTCARQCVSPTRCQCERFGSLPVSIIVWFNCWLYAKRKYLLIILQKERSPAGRGAGVRCPGVSRHAQQTCQPTCPAPTRCCCCYCQRETLSSLRAWQVCDGVPRLPIFSMRMQFYFPGWLSHLFCASALEITHEACAGDPIWVWAWHVSVSTAMAPQPHGRAADTLRVISKGWTLCLSWRCSRTSDGRGDTGASTWTRWALSSSGVSSDPPAMGGPSLASEEDSALVATVYITHAVITSCLGDGRVCAQRGGRLPCSSEVQRLGSWPVWAQAGQCPWSPGSSSLKQW